MARSVANSIGCSITYLSPGLHCNHLPESARLYAGATKDVPKMISLRLNAESKRRGTKHCEPARAGRRALPARCSLVRLVVGLPVLLVTSAGLGAADEVTDWNHIM